IASFKRSIIARREPGAAPAGIVRGLWHYGRFFVFWGAFGAFQLSSDVWSLNAFRGERLVGTYALAYLIASGWATLIGNIIGQLLALVPMTLTRLTGLGVIKIGASLATVGMNVIGAMLFGVAGVTGTLVITSVAYAGGLAVLNLRIMRSLVRDVNGRGTVSLG